MYVIDILEVKNPMTDLYGNGRRGQLGDQNYLELLCASEGTLSCWSQLHLLLLVSTPVSRMVDVRQAASRKNKCRIVITT
jgi:hypothetical protein